MFKWGNKSTPKKAEEAKPAAASSNGDASQNQRLNNDRKLHSFHSEAKSEVGMGMTDSILNQNAFSRSQDAQVNSLNSVQETVERRKFLWNFRTCTGTRLHEIILKQPITVDDIYEMRTILEAQGQSAVDERFRYETEFQGKKQEGSGQALHLAVTRECTETVNLLLEYRANLNGMVTRDGRDHYDVVHSAVFNEGRGGHEEIVKCLIEAGAMPQRNLDGHYPLHKAFQVGAYQLIQPLKEHMKENGLLKTSEEGVNEPVDTPLQMGLKAGKLTVEQLAEAATISEASVKVFLRDEPVCLTPFFRRLAASGERLQGSVLAEIVSVQDLCHLLEDNPEAATALLDALVDTPKVESERWHKLPTRMDFGPRTLLERVSLIMNPPRRMFHSYQPTTVWEFDLDSFDPPPWHVDKVDLTGDRDDIHDTTVSVCYLPDILCTQFLMGLMDCEDESIFTHDVAIACLDRIWWGAAFKIDVLNLMVSITGLILLTVQRLEYFDPLTAHTSAPARMLRPHGGGAGATHAKTSGGVNATDSPWGSSNEMAWDVSATPSIAAQFIGARGLVDFLHEIIQFLGYCAMGRGLKYWTFGNAMDIFRSCLAMALYIGASENSAVEATLVVIYWFRLLEISFSESLMRELLPIQNLVRGLWPSLSVFGIAVGAFTHAKWVMHSAPLWPHTFHESFTLLMTAGLPAEEESDSLTLWFSFFAVSVFSVFFLNIFIGVITEQYGNEKERVAEAFQLKRCRLCFAFLLRANVLPTWLMSSTVAAASILLCLAVIITTLVLSFIQMAPANTSFFVFVFCLLFCTLAIYQDVEDSFSFDKAPADQPPRHLWMFKADDVDEEDSTDYVKKLQQELRALKAELAQKGGRLRTASEVVKQTDDNGFAAKATAEWKSNEEAWKPLSPTGH